MSVPVAVTAISGETISRAGATNLEKISELAPQVMITRASSGNGGIISIRGLGTPALDAALDQSVSVNIDGVQAGRGNIIAQGFFDLGQVEVLKGPQALFFGKNSPAGVISLRSANPTDAIEGYVKAGYEFVANQRYGEAAIGGPLSETIKGRIAVRGSKMDGYVRNTAIDLATNPFYPGFSTFAGPKRNGGEELLGRATLIYTPSDAFDASLKVSGGTYKDNGPTSQAYCPGLTLPTVNFVVAVTDPAGDCEADNRYQNAGIDPTLAATQQGARDGTPFTDTWSTLAALTMNYHFPNLTLTSVTGLMKLKLDQASSFSYSSYAVIYGAISEDTRTLSQELRLVSDYDGSLNFTLGGFYEDMKRSSEVNIGFLGTVFGPSNGKYHSYDNLATNRGKTYSAFGQLRWKLLEPLELAAGVRYTHEKKDVDSVNTFVHPIQGVVFGLRGQGNPLNINFKDSNWSPEVTLSWKPQEGTLVYAAYKTGYKSGGVSNPSRLSAISTAADLIYKSENSRGGEIGLKSYLADRTVRIEATAYSYLYKNLQVSAFDQLASMSFLTNAASARIKGAELSGEWNPARGLKLNGSATYNIAKYKSFPNAICYLGQTAPTGCVGGQQDLTGQPLTRAPKWTFSGGGSYDVALASSMMLGFNANANYTSKYHTQEDHDPATVQKGFWLLNGGVRLYDQQAGWELSVIGRNLANKYYRKLCNGKFSAGQYSCGYIRAREVAVQIGYNF
ncbi:MAG: TonB-dependent receptor [Sphingomonadaceae bacterium]